MFTSLLIGWCTSGIAEFLNIFLTVNCPVQIVLRNQTINWLSWWEKCNVGFLTGTCCCIYLNRAPDTFYMYLDSVKLMFSTFRWNPSSRSYWDSTNEICLQALTPLRENWTCAVRQKNLLHTFAKVWVVLQIWFSEGDFNFTAEMVQKAAEAKLLRKAQRQAAMDAAKMAKRERG